MVKVKFAQGVYLHLSSRQLVTSEAEVRLLTDLTLLIWSDDLGIEEGQNSYQGWAFLTYKTC